MSAIPKGIVRLPQVEQLLQEPLFAPYIHQLSRPLVTDAIRETLAVIRRSEAFRNSHLASAEQRADLHRSIYQTIEKRCQSLIRQRHHKVINATGTVVHTNLGRSPIDPVIWDAVSDVNTGQCNLEIKLINGKRGQRKGLVDRLVSRLVGAEDAMVVNNNASSIYLMLSELAKGKEVIVSRGEQIQIGGGFRIPDILALSGAKLVEVGTTNITTAEDYLSAVTENTAMVLMVHCSNFAIRGFTESADLREVARKLPEHVVLAVDQGSGLTTETFAAEESPVASYIKDGADIVCFSGDKIIGGPQAGIICGKVDLVEKLEKNPLMRAFRPSRIVYSLLEELLIRKLNKSPEGQGIAEKSAMNPRRIKKQAEQLTAVLGDHVRLVETEMIIGGGTLPDEYFPSWALEVVSHKSAEKILADLRNMPLPVIGIIRNNVVQLNMAAILPHDLQRLEHQLKDYFIGESA
ncbi:L-seryl-tRNA(Sec) selenium transferase [Endozoicomonas sp.]|nr:L-seryl-tRNA(Sec) selenium transferase [Endozoicomonas sp.]